MIRNGDKFLCFKTGYYNGSESIIFQEGKIYESHTDGCIIDYDGCTYHSFSDGFWQKYLIKLTPLCRYNYGISENLFCLQKIKQHGYVYNRKTKKFVKK